MFGKLVRWLQFRGAVNELNQLPESLLKDIGMHKSNIRTKCYEHYYKDGNYYKDYHHKIKI